MTRGLKGIAVALLWVALCAGCKGQSGGQDARAADSRQDQVLVDAPPPDGLAPDGPAPDQGQTPAFLLLSGGIGGAGPASAGGFILLEGGFTRGGASCVPSAGLCLTGGITP